ncbi:MAG TPA: nucleoside triphosphate pyrophosphohydrolase [Capsulimonadaceae bacterium]|jgi:tetrapyrrole methylase family protein/MazG family protein
MESTKITLVGLGTGSADALTLGAIRALRNAKPGTILLRTRVHPTVAWLEENEGILFTQSYDELYELAERFEDIYSTIASDVIDTARRLGSVVYAVPGHPFFGETSVAQILQRAAQEGIEVVSTPSTSFVETVIAGATVEVSQLAVVDALELPDLQYVYRSFQPPFAFDRYNLVYQVYDRDIASATKLALLEYYPPEHPITVVGGSENGDTQSRIVALAELDRPAQEFDHLSSLLVPPMPESQRRHDFYSLLNIMARLREPDTGCPWDREQTPETLRKYVLEEAYEVLDALDSGDPDKYAEELGDLLLQVAFHAQLAREDYTFTIDDVIGHIVNKLIRRHPHVFGDLSVSGAEEVLVNWEAIKLTEKGYEDRKSVLDGVVRALPALTRAQEISKKAAKAGFEWESIDGVFEKLHEEIAELHEARAKGNHAEVANELGDLLFTVVNLARFEKVDAEDALQRMVNRFIDRFKRIEDSAAEQGLKIEELTQSEMEVIWQQAKREQRS